MSYTFCNDNDNDDDDDDDGDDVGWQTSGTVTAKKLSATLNVTCFIQSTTS